MTENERKHSSKSSHVHHDSDKHDYHHDVPEKGGISRRDLLGSTAAGAAAGALGVAGITGALAAPPPHAGTQGPPPHAGTQGPPPHAQGGDGLLIKGGTVISMDPTVGDFETADVLIKGSKIEAIGPDISDASASQIDAKGMIVIPGFCDPHIHSWQGQIPRLIPNQNSGADPTHNYFTVYHNTFAPVYRPEDMHIGTLMTMLVAINGGITTVCDNSHNSRSSEHSDAAIEALFDSGIRGVHASGPPSFGDWDLQWPGDLYRIAEKYFASEDQLVTLRMLPRAGFSGDDPVVLQVRQDLDLWISLDGGSGLPLVELYAAGTYNGNESFNHGTNFSVDKRAAIVDGGAKVNMCPRIETQFWTGGAFGRDGTIPIQEWLDSGLRPGISGDDPGTYAISMFTEMQVLYAYQRAMANNAAFNGDPNPPAPITVRDVLEFATIRGAEGCGVDHKVGTLTPGKEADIVVINANDIAIYPVANAICTVVEGATPSTVDTVIIGGTIKKWGGKLVGFDLDAIKSLADDSRDYLFAASGWPKNAIDLSN